MSLVKFSILIVLVAVLVYYFFIQTVREEVILETVFGTLKGLKSISRDGREFNSFTGIKFANAPRFQPPVESEKWEGILDATETPPLCLQADFVWKKVFGTEDCLYLNVYTPKISKAKEKLLPVMVLIHGGYFMMGGADIYKPNYFMDEDVVLVTIQYRLGALGFLSTGDDVISGNMGMKDQVVALKWVQAAIKDFGGDPSSVTIFGESAGSNQGILVRGYLVDRNPLVHIPLARLFHRAISQSGTGLCPFVSVNKDAKKQAINLGKRLECPTDSSENLANCLSSKSGFDIASAHTKFFEVFYGPEDIFNPTIEKGENTSNAFLSADPRKLYEEGQFSKVPWLTGVNSEEGCWLTSPIINDGDTLQKFYKEFKSLAPNQLVYKDRPDVADKILKFYFGESPKQFTKDDYQKMTDMFSDRYFFACHGETIRSHAKQAPTFSYYFTYKNPLGLGAGIAFEASKGKYPVVLELLYTVLKRWFYSKMDWEIMDYGVCHADEIQYQFSPFKMFEISKGDQHYEFSKTLVKLWVTFAKNGHPGRYEGIEWEKVTPGKAPRYMHIGDPPKMIDEPFTQRVKFWDSLQLTPK